ncbi:MAG: ABC transporter permease [Bacteroidota bacterium]|nr:ABC transporter permease [Bacteroidota bacterium]
MDSKTASFSNRLNLIWLIKMAWRDSRRSRSRLVLFIASIVLGIAALVATFSLGNNLQRDIDNQARTLVGADLVIQNNRPSGAEIQPLLDSIGDQKAQERSFASMVYFVKSGKTRLVQVRALQGNYPFYGTLETEPLKAASEFRRGPYALVDKTLMLQFNSRLGDSIKVGEVTFAIKGILNKSPGRTEISTTVAPPVYIPLQYLEQTQLNKKGSRIEYHYYFKMDSLADIDKLVSAIEPRLEKEGMEYETVATRKKNTGRSFDDFTRFLILISFIALLLGCIGVASSIHIYIREKINSIAILRCLGVNSIQAFLIYLIQVAGIGLIGAVLGSVLGVFIQQLLPPVVKDFFPVEMSTVISWRAVGQGILLGVSISILFALLPLIAIRKISPAFALRIVVERTRRFRDPMMWVVYAAILLFIILFTRWQMESWRQAIVFAGSVLGAFLLLAAVAWLLRWTVRRFFPASWSYIWRQGFANLYRPNNQTIILVTTIGLGVMLISTLYLVQGILLKRVSMSTSKNQSNMILFDIQTDQQAGVESVAKQFHLPVLEKVPIVTMRIEEINGKNALQYKQDTLNRIPRRAFEPELRVTYRDTLTSSEKLTAGRWIGKHGSPGDPVYISLEGRYASRIGVKPGDQILFNVQGTLIPAVVGSLRSVEWRRIQTNFRVVFPVGVLEDAPQFHVMMTRVPSPDVSAAFQQAVVHSYPNISVIDLGLILGVVEDLLAKIGLVISFMAAFSILTGVVVLISSVLVSKYPRIQESVLLRTIGASRKQILAITAIEYFFTGALAAATGLFLSLASSWALAKFSFEASFSPEVFPLFLLFIIVSLLTVGIGLLNCREILNKPPLEILRKEG